MEYMLQTRSKHSLIRRYEVTFEIPFKVIDDAVELFENKPCSPPLLVIRRFKVWLFNPVTFYMNDLCDPCLIQKSGRGRIVILRSNRFEKIPYNEIDGVGYIIYRALKERKKFQHAITDIKLRMQEKKNNDMMYLHAGMMIYDLLFLRKKNTNGDQKESNEPTESGTTQPE